MDTFISSRILARMAGVHWSTINKLVIKGVLKPHVSKGRYLFEAGYARRLAPIIAVRSLLANSLRHD